jgi:hypothetical protein
MSEVDSGVSVDVSLVVMFLLNLLYFLWIQHLRIRLGEIYIDIHTHTDYISVKLRTINDSPAGSSSAS